jgi:hypothetical protein
MPIEDLELVLAWNGQEGSNEPGLRLRFRRADAVDGFCHPKSLIAGELSLATISASWTSDFLCLGYDLHGFVSQLEQLHRTLQGRVKFTNSEGSLAITIVAVAPSRGQLAVGGEVEVPLFTDSRDVVLAVGILPHPLAAIRSEGLVWEQSYIPAVVQAIRTFLRPSGPRGFVPWGHPAFPPPLWGPAVLGSAWRIGPALGSHQSQ